tara:strand:+ start:1173 stop:1769 length:597 start_codon:yes stop_codon:yes gene_type:complete
MFVKLRQDFNMDQITSTPNLEMLVLEIGQNKSKDAFQAVFQHIAPRLKGFAMRQGTDPSMAEEIVQETMVKVWQKAEQFDPSKASALTWVFTIGRNTRVDLLRKANRPEPDMSDPSLVPDTEPLPQELISRNQEAHLLREVLSKLPSEQQKVLHLAFFEDKPHRQIASELGIPLGTVKSRIRLAMDAIRKIYGEALCA